MRSSSLVAIWRSIWNRGSISIDRNGTTQDICTIAIHSLIFEGTSNSIFLFHVSCSVNELICSGSCFASLWRRLQAIHLQPFLFASPFPNVAWSGQHIHRPNTAEDPCSRKVPPEVSNVVANLPFCGIFENPSTNSTTTRAPTTARVQIKQKTSPMYSSLDALRPTL